MEAFESGLLDLPDFYFTGDDYRYRFDLEAKQRFLELLRDRFNSGVRYNGRSLKWDTVIKQKTIEMSRFIASRATRLDFSDPSPNLFRTDEGELRRRILNLSQSEAERLRMGKSTLHYLQRNVRSADSLRMYKKVRDRLNVQACRRKAHSTE